MFQYLIQRSKSAKNAGTASQFTIPLETRLKDNVNQIKMMLNSPSDLIIKEFNLGPMGLACAAVCMDGLVNKELINEQLLQNLANLNVAGKPLPILPNEIVSYLETEVLPLQEIRKAQQLDQLLHYVLSGDTALLIDGAEQALVIGSRGWKSRSIEEPLTEAIIRGPRDGFIEDLRTNMASVRLRIRDPNLRFDTFYIGRRSRKEAIVAYIEGIVHPELVAEVKKRISTIDMDDAEGSGFIEQWLSDNFLSPFPQILNTERPDKVAGALLQGKIAILVDGTPFQLILPATLSTSFQSPEDFYQNWMISSLIRCLRLFAAFIAAFLPALYIALVEYHHGLIPSKLAFSFAGAREGVPFPAVVEAFAMEATLEILREAGIRLPKPIGQTIGIVGGLVIGEAAVAAGIVSPIMVIVVAITAISSFALPSYAIATTLRIIRFMVMIAASIFGLFGIILAYIMVNVHLVNLKSFGIPYSAPFAPMFFKDWKDLIFRAPVTLLDERPQMLQTKDKKRMTKE